VGITGLLVSSLNNRGVVAVAGPDQEITQEDVDRVLQADVSLPYLLTVRSFMLYHASILLMEMLI